jgi:hypothetical protein
MDKKDKELHEQRKSMYETADLYRKSFLNKQTGMIDSKYLESRQCPVCGSTNFKNMFTKNGGQYVKCEECSMVYLNPVFKDDCLELYYINNNTNQANAHSEESLFYRNIYSGGLEQILHAKNCKRILDIGCSSGLFLDIAKQQGLETFGIELNQLELKLATSKGHKVWNTTIEKTDLSTKFDAITLWDVFEHIKNGKQYLETLKPHLTDGGLIFMQIPSSQSLAARILHEKCNMFDGLEHVNLYNKNTITRVAEQSGFKVAGIRSIIDELGPINNYLHYEHPYFGSFESKTELPLLTTDHIHQNFLGYKFQIVLTAR